MGLGLLIILNKYESHFWIQIILKTLKGKSIILQNIQILLCDL